MYVMIIMFLLTSLWIILSSTNALKGDFNSDGSLTLNDAIFGVQVLACMRKEPPKPSFVMINLGDSLTNGTQSGLQNVHEPTQRNGFVHLLAEQLKTKVELEWSIPYLKKNTGCPPEGLQYNLERISPDEIPYNLGVDSATIKQLIHEKTTDNPLLKRLMAPIPNLVKKPVSQLEAALYVAGLHPDKKVIFTVWTGNNDVLWSVINNYGQEITEKQIKAYLNDTSAEHDLISVKNNLTHVVKKLKAIPGSHIFIGTLPYMTRPAFFFSKKDIERLTQFPNPKITALVEGESIGFGPFLHLANLGAFSAASNNETANAAISQLTDTHKLSPNEIAIVDERIDQINEHIQSLTSPGKVTVVNTFDIFQQIYENKVTIKGHQIYKTFGCGGFSFDAFHPSNTTHAMLANKFIEKINESLQLSIPLIDIKAVFDTDPYQDRDGDHFAPGPGDNIVGSEVLVYKLFDCDDSNKSIGATFVTKLPCQAKKK